VSIKLPKEILSEEKFLELADFAIHCRVKRVKDVVKLKLRTRKYLYTYKTDPNSADRILSSISCDVIEL
jgi:large subunit ribosomal protein L38e